MQTLSIYLVVITALLALNIYQFYLLKRKPKKTNSRDATELLHDLTRGAGLVRVEVIDPDTIFLRSPRDLN